MKAIRRTIIDQVILPKPDLGFNENLEIDWMQWMSEEYGGGDFFSDDEEIEIPDEAWEQFLVENGGTDVDDEEKQYLWRDFTSAYERGVPAFDEASRPTLDDTLYLYEKLSKEDQHEFLKKATGVDFDRFFKGIGIAVERM